MHHDLYFDAQPILSSLLKAFSCVYENLTIIYQQFFYQTVIMRLTPFTIDGNRSRLLHDVSVLKLYMVDQEYKRGGGVPGGGPGLPPPPHTLAPAQPTCEGIHITTYLYIK